MSYILEALKKSQTDDRDEQVPDLSSEHNLNMENAPFAEEDSYRRWIWPLVVMGLLLVIVVFGFIALNPSSQKIATRYVNSQSPVSQETNGATTNNPQKAAAVNKDQTGSSTSDTIVLNKPVVVGEPVVKKRVQTVLQERSRQSNPVASQNSTTQNTQQTSITKTDLPQLIYTTHIYATQPDDRFVMLNGEAYAEGDSVSSDLKVQEILENDLVLIYKGRELVIPSLEDVNVH